ncbi:hypothetical protein ACSU6B_17555 [Neobacillus sp. C211]|uniref:hypothetical protein n=1 Tax=unclassified Neobacillus TaxID=2675272 RepID=UPI00397B32F5
MLSLNKGYMLHTIFSILAVLIAISVSINPFLSASIIIALFCGILLFLWPKKSFELTLIIMLSIPANISSYEFFHLNIPMINLDIFKAILLLVYLVLLIQRLMRKKSIFSQTGWSTVILFSTFVLYYLLGKYYGNGSVFTDAKNFMFIPLVFTLGVSFYQNDEDSIRSFMKIVSISSFILSVITIFMFFTKHSLFQPIFASSFEANTTRVGFANHSNFAFAIPLLILTLKLKLLNKIWTKFILLTLLLMIISLIFGESRSLIFGVVINTIFITFYTTYFVDKKSIIDKTVRLMFVFFVIPVFLIIIIFLIPSVNERVVSVFERFNSVYSEGGSESLDTRNISNEYYYDLIKQKISGYGMGKEMWLINSLGHPFVQGMNIDNAFITLAYKFGVFGLLAWSFFYFKRIVNVFKSFKNKRNSIEEKFAKCVLFCLPMVLLNSTFFTAQLVMNSTVYSFTLVLLALFHSGNSSINKLNEITKLD